MTGQTRGGAFQSSWLILRSDALRKSCPTVRLGRRNEEGRCCTDLGEEGRAPRAGVDGGSWKVAQSPAGGLGAESSMDRGPGRQHHAVLPLAWLQTQSNWQLHSGATVPLSYLLLGRCRGSPVHLHFYQLPLIQDYTCKRYALAGAEYICTSGPPLSKADTCI